MLFWGCFGVLFQFCFRHAHAFERQPKINFYFSFISNVRAALKMQKEVVEKDLRSMPSNNGDAMVCSKQRLTDSNHIHGANSE